MYFSFDRITSTHMPKRKKIDTHHFFVSRFIWLSGYKSYENVWAELKTMGDEVDTLVDKNTLGGIQFG